MFSNKISLVKGPGQHADSLSEVLQENSAYFSAFDYYPLFSASFYRPGEPNTSIKDLRLDSVSSWAWRLHNRLPFLFRRPWHLDIYYNRFDRWVESKLDPSTEILWAWSQMSLHTIRAFKRRSNGITVLEYPMIHPVDWQRVILSEAKKLYGSTRLKYYSLFTEAMHRKMLAEIDASDHIVVLSEFAKKSFLSNGIPEKKLKKILLPIKVEQIQKDKTLPDKCIFLYVGRVELWKGVHYLIKAFSRLNDSDTELWVVGRVLPEMQSFLRDNIRSDMRFFGNLDKSELQQIYKSASVFVFPSLQDSFGMVLLEAMSNGLPVIASKNSAAPDLIEHGKEGFIVDPTNEEELVEYLRFASFNRERLKEMGLAAQKKVSMFSDNNSYQKMICKLVSEIL